MDGRSTPHVFEKGRPSVAIFGISVPNNSYSDIVRQLDKRLQISTGEMAPLHIVTINAYCLLLAQKNWQYYDLLRRLFLVPDGWSVRVAFFLHGQWLRCVWPGVDLLVWLLDAIDSRGGRVLVVCKKDGLSFAKEIERSFMARWGNVRFDVFPSNNESVVDCIGADGETYDLLVTNHGMPEQEMLIDRLLMVGLRTKIAIGVGGALDFLTGKQRRAPWVFRVCGCEWLWRFFLRPVHHFSRVWQSVVIFPIFVVWERITKW